MIKDPLHQLDLDYYRTVLLQVTRAELERLQQELSANTGAKSRNKSAGHQEGGRIGQCVQESSHG
jgi:hypothetical protein